jgi:hypothetical protein
MRVNTVVIFLSLEEAAVIEQAVTDIVQSLPPVKDWLDDKTLLIIGMSHTKEEAFQISANNAVVEDGKIVGAMPPINIKKEYNMPKGIKVKQLLAYIGARVQQLIFIMDQGAPVQLGDVEMHEGFGGRHGHIDLIRSS